MSDTTIGLIDKEEVRTAVFIYLQAFPQRARLWFRRQQQAQAFFEDLFELMRLTHGNTFFAARRNGHLVGYLILTTPEGRLFRGLLKPDFFARVIFHTLSGRYGFSPAFLKKLTQDLLTGHQPETGQALKENPHIYVIAVDAQQAGHGIGSRLLTAAVDACRKKYNRLWLLVEPENTAAFAFYERRGFHAELSGTSQTAMVLNLVPFTQLT